MGKGVTRRRSAPLGNAAALPIAPPPLLLLLLLLQGPFLASEMREWFLSGYFADALPVRPGGLGGDEAGPFVPLAELFPTAREYDAAFTGPPPPFPPPAKQQTQQQPQQQAAAAAAASAVSTDPQAAPASAAAAAALPSLPSLDPQAPPVAAAAAAAGGVPPAAAAAMSAQLLRLQSAQALQAQMQAQVAAAHAELAQQVEVFQGAQATLAGLERELGEGGAGGGLPGRAADARWPREGAW